MWIAAAAIVILLVAIAVPEWQRHQERRRRQERQKAFQEGPGQFPADLEPRDVIGGYGAFLTQHEIEPTSIYDESLLPFQKALILDELLAEIGKADGDMKVGQLAWATILLAQFQPGIGETPLKLVDFSVINGLKETASRGRAQEIARRSGASADRYMALKPVVEVELERLKHLIDAAAGKRWSPAG